MQDEQRRVEAGSAAPNPETEGMQPEAEHQGTGVADVGFDAAPDSDLGLESAMPDPGDEPEPGDLAHQVAKARATLRERFPECAAPRVGHCATVNDVLGNLEAVELSLCRAQDRIDRGEDSSLAEPASAAVETPPAGGDRDQAGRPDGVDEA